MVKVSIVMPMYNQEKYIAECLNSALGQSLKEIEIIVVNDGSTDRSLEIVQKAAKKDPRVIVIDKENGGYGAAMNAGFAKASGEYIGILETDDYVPAEMYETLYDTAKKHGSADFVIQPGDRIAQAVVAPVMMVDFETVLNVSDDTTRSNGGFGSTGTK